MARSNPELFQRLQKELLVKVNSIQSEMVVWQGRNVLPLMAVKRIASQIKKETWDKMSAQEQDHFGEGQ
mgnify:CR=1 FL=1|jgi:hypothetical protein